MLREDIKKLIVNNQRRLQKLNEKKAIAGLNVDPMTLIEIEDIETRIEELQTELEVFEDSGVDEELQRGLRVQIYLHGDLSSIPEERQSSAIDALAGLLRIPSGAIEVYHVSEGSIVYELRIPSNAVQRLHSLLQSNSGQLRLLGIERVILERETSEIEEWVIEEGRFHLVTSTHPTISSGVHRKPQRAIICSTLSSPTPGGGAMFADETKHPILTDRPANKDGLDFQPYIDSLAELIIDPATSSPLTIGVFGQWGSGKTSLMQMIKQQVDARGYKTAWFNAWKYEREEIALWRVLILRTLDALRPRKEDGSPYSVDELPDPGQKALLEDLDRLEQSVYSTVEWTELGKWTVDWAKALEGTVEGAAEIALSLVPGAGPLVTLLRQARNAAKGDEVAPITEAFQRQAQEFRREQLRSVEQFITTFEETIAKYVMPKRRLVVFVDDLDRCLPERTVEVLEAIKLFLDVPGCIFVLGVDPAKVQEGVRLRYKTAPTAAEGANYLEKIIQVPFILPQIDTQDMRGFVEQLQVAFPHPQQQCTDVFALGLDPNPRQIKRAINIFLLLWKLASKRRLKVGADLASAQTRTEVEPAPTPGPLLSEVLTPVRLAKVVVIQHSHPDLYDLLKLTPRYLRDLEIHFVEQRDEPGREEAETGTGPGEMTEAGAAPKASLPGPLQDYAERASLGRLFRLFPDDEKACFRFLTPTDLRLYITLAGRAETERRPETAAKKARLDFEPEMVQILAGQFIMGTTPEEAKLFREEAQRETPQHTVELPAFEIGRYPVTNLEYKAFVEAANHRPPNHWEGGRLPDELADHPVTHVSWEDAAAYCQWLAETTQKPYRLPTEQEWERAARGINGRRYPWGNEWEEKRANTQEAGIGATTPVGQYSPDGDSPEGCADMVGNVGEWTDSPFEPYAGSSYQDQYYGQGLKVLRGGYYGSDKTTARAAFRFGDLIRYRYWGRGFRVVVDATPSPLDSESSEASK